MHYCIDRDTVQPKKPLFFGRDVHNKLENDLETNNKQSSVLDLTMWTLVMHTHTLSLSLSRTHTRCVCVRVCVCVYVCLRAWAGVRGQVGLCVGG